MSRAAQRRLLYFLFALALVSTLAAALRIQIGFLVGGSSFLALVICSLAWIRSSDDPEFEALRTSRSLLGPGHTSLPVMSVTIDNEPSRIQEVDQPRLVDTKVLDIDLQAHGVVGHAAKLQAFIDRLETAQNFTSDQLLLIRQAWIRVFDTADDSGWSLQELSVGTQIGDFRIEQLLSEGGAGQVYGARRMSDDGKVALKVLRNTRLTDRFRREMDLIQHLAHPNIVVAYEVGEQQGVLYIAMERLAGPDLNVHVRDAGPLSWQASLDVISQSAGALLHAHQRGLVHRDVKPGNLIYDGFKRVKVADLGLAALTGEVVGDQPPKFKSSKELIAGTVDFMAPEQARSLTAATAQSDIYSLGATWYYLLTGRSRVSGKSVNEKLGCLFTNEGLQS